MKRTIAALVFAGLLVLGTGCANCGWVYAPFGPGTLCTGGPCDTCGGCAEPACATCAAPVAAAGPCDCAPCGDPCGGPAAPCGPLTWLFALLNCGYCGDGCGEIWWGDFHSAPPECCDPCNRMGDYTGGSGPAMPVQTGGCSSCGGGQSIDYTFQSAPRVLAQAPQRAAASSPIRQAAKPIPTDRQ